MFRISDILKKYKEEKAKPEAEQAKKQPEEKEAASEAKMSISSTFAKEIKKSSSAEVAAVYESAVSWARKIYRPDLEYERGFLAGIAKAIEGIMDLLNEDNAELLVLSLADYPKLEDYLFYHVVNVCIISMQIGRGLGYDRGRLLELGEAAFLHDIGMVKFPDIIQKTEALSQAEYNTLKQHPQIGFEILSHIDKEPLSAIILDTVLKEHERVDGSGYPEGLKGDAIPESAQIVGLADVYEAVVHQRPYHKKRTPLEMLSEILSGKEAFHHKLIKVLIERLGVFPVGTLVRLNTREVGIVLKTNPDSPLRPVVEILYDTDGRELKEAKQVDLSKNAVLYIEECVTIIRPATGFA